GEVIGQPPPWWGRVPPGEVLAEVRFPPAAAGAVLDAAAGAGMALRGSAVAGRLLLATDGQLPVSALRKTVEDAGGRVVVLATPDDGPDGGVDRWGQISGLALMRRVKERFDPGRRMSPGRFVGGI
ncbi:FAD-linked oxidase, partial [Nonomuraea aridisoli]